MKYLKYLPQILFGFKDVTEKYQQETGRGRPWYASRTFVYSALCFVGTVVTIVFGVELDKVQLQELADNLTVAVPAVIAIVGAVMSFVAQIRSKRNGS